jgi:hypothetical protein
VILRKFGVWIALVFTLIACVWVRWQENLKPPSDLQAEPNLIVNKHLNKLYRPSLESFVEKKISLRAQDMSDPKNVFPSFAPLNSQSEKVEANATVSPTNPYIYAGKISEDGIWIVFLTDGNNNYVVKVGDRLQGGWKLINVKLDELTFLYEPLKTEFKLDTGVGV